MGRVFSVHEYELKPGVEGELFEAAFQRAAEEGLFKLPGLIKHVFLRGIKGGREQKYTAIWIYEDRAAWEHLWGPPGEPRPPHRYPGSWKRWELEFLAPFLQTEPDAISFTSYEEVA